MTRPILNRGNIQLRKLVTVNKSIGLVIPSNFVKKMQLKPGQYMELELDETSESFTVERLNIG